MSIEERVETLLRLWKAREEQKMMTRNEERIHELFEELVPSVGKAENKAGEIVRAYSRIGYRLFNDGDHIGIGYGKHTCNSAARYLMENGSEKMVDILKDMWGMYNEDEYEAKLNDLEDAVLEYLESNPQLRTEETVDMFDYWEPEDEEDEEEDDEYEEYWDEEEEDEEEWYD